MYLPKLREIKEALTSFFTAPYTTKFPKEPFKISKHYRGFPRFDETECIGCGACVQICPATAIEMTDDKENLKRVLRVNYTSCIQCGQCEEHCTTEKGITCTTEYSHFTTDLNDPDTVDTVEKEIVLCEICGEVIGCRDHLKWIKDKLGAKAYAHPNFLLETQAQFFDVDPSKPKDKIRREDQIKEVCPKCRYKIVVSDEF